jgi:superkiller protein 3
MSEQTGSNENPLQLGLLYYLRQGLIRRSPLTLTFAIGLLVFSASLLMGLGYRLSDTHELPGIVLNHLAEGDRYFEIGEFDRAVKAYATSAAVAPDDDQAYFKLAVAARRSNQPDVATKALQSLLRLEPRNIGAHYLLGLTFLEQGRFELAVRHNVAAVRINPNFADAYNNLGTAWQNLGKFDKALVFYRKAVELDPNHAMARQNVYVLERLRGGNKP